MNPTILSQGFAAAAVERLPMPAAAELTEAQRACAEALIAGPRKGVKGPFIPLLQSPALLESLAAVGAHLRFGSALPTRVSEFVMLVVARALSNQFEWAVHFPLARQAGTAASTLLQLQAGARPTDMSEEEALAFDCTKELMATHGLSDITYARAHQQWQARGVVELTGLIGYFTTVCWIMNVSRTPVAAAEGVEALGAFPA